jgi:aspartate-semialdehyde dehydrogenase
MAMSNWLLTGGDSLLAKEISDLVDTRKLPVKVTRAADGAEERILSADGDDVTVSAPLDALAVEDADVVLLCGSPDGSRRAAALVHSSAKRPVIVDARGHLEDLPEARLRAPVIEHGESFAASGTVHILAHPAALALARLLLLIGADHKIRRSVATIMEPVSQSDRAGIDELHRQAVALFSFQQMPKEIFDTQVVFNLLPRYGDEAVSSLQGAAQRVEKHLATLLGASGLPLPSVRLIHAPVFHGHCQNVWIEFHDRPSVSHIEGLLEAAGIDTRRSDTEPASNVGVAGESGITVSDIVEDPAEPRALWLWMASDNLRTLADSALLTAGMITQRKGAR